MSDTEQTLTITLTKAQLVQAAYACRFYAEHTDRTCHDSGSATPFRELARLFADASASHNEEDMHEPLG